MPPKSSQPVWPGRTYQASAIVKEPREIIPTIKGRYTLIRDMSLSGNFDTMMQAVNLMARTGWAVHTSHIDREGTGTAMYCLMERTAERPSSEPE